MEYKRLVSDSTGYTKRMRLDNQEWTFVDPNNDQLGGKNYNYLTGELTWNETIDKNELGVNFYERTEYK